MEIKACIDEIVRLEELKRELAEQIAECKAAAKSEGFNVTAINRAVKLRLETDAQRQKREAAEEEAELYEAGRVIDRDAPTPAMVDAAEQRKQMLTAARVADERRRVGAYPVRGAKLEALMREQRLPPHDADGVVSERNTQCLWCDKPSEDVICTECRVTAEYTRRLGDLPSPGVLKTLVAAVDASLAPITAPARKPTDADLEGVS